jgi:hypothetical protein
MDMTLRWQGPWESEDLSQIPAAPLIFAIVLGKLEAP